MVAFEQKFEGVETLSVIIRVVSTLIALLTVVVISHDYYRSRLAELIKCVS